MKTLNRALFAFSLLFASATSLAEPLDRVLAIVDNAPVLASDVNNRLRFLKLQADARGRDFPAMSQALSDRVLERLIEERALRAEASRQGFSVSDEQVNQALNNLAASLGLQEGLLQLARAAESYGIPFERLRVSTETELLINAARNRAIQNEIRVSDQEARALIEREGLNLGQVQISQILVALPQAPTPEQLQMASQRITQIQQALDQGAVFASLAREFSDGPEAINGGDLGWREISALNANFRQALAQTNDQGISAPFRTRAGLHILRLEGRRSSETSLITQVRARHILLKPNAVRDSEATRRELAGLVSQLQSGADFGELAQQHSEDPVSASRGGELGWADPAAYVPEFTQALSLLEPGQRSGLVQTQFGWHVIELLDRREVEGANVGQLQQAKDIIVQRQADEVGAAWSRRILNNAYVERL